jgi:RNA polymerase sigma-70 factor (ECF subfamily)
VQTELESVHIKKAKSGDQEAFAELFRMHYTFLYKYVYKMTMNKELTEDLVQDTMIKCYDNLSKYNETSKFSSWIMTIATRIYIDRYRKKNREKKWVEKEKEIQIRQMKWQVESEGVQWSDLMQSLATLDQDVRLSILLKHYYGFSYDEIAKILNIKEGTVKSKTHYGLKKLRKELKDDDGGK